MSRQILGCLLALVLIGIFPVPSKAQDGIVTVPSGDIPSDGTGIVPDDNQTVPSNDTSIVVSPGEDASRISKALGFVYNLTIGPTVSIIRFFLDPIFSLIRGILSPVLAIVNYLLGSLGLPNLGDLLTQIVVGVQGYLSQIISNLSGFLGALLTPDQPSRSRRSIAGTLMSPVTVPLGYVVSIVSLPWKIASTAFNVITSPIRLGYKAASYPVSGAYSIGSWPIRKIFRMLGFGGNDDDNNNNAGNATEPISGDEAQSISDKNQETMVDQIVGAVSEAAQDMMLSAAASGFKLLKDDVLPAVDTTFETYQDSDMIPESIRGYMKNFHQGYKLLKTLRVL